MKEMSKGQQGDKDKERERKMETSQSDLTKMIRSRLPAESKITLITDQSRFIIGAIKEVQDSMLQGGVPGAHHLLFLFLRDVKSTLVISTRPPPYRWSLRLSRCS